eukprot:4102933-Pyramimonas_sp.AAC.1
MRLTLLAGIRAIPHIWDEPDGRPGAGCTRDLGLVVLVWRVESYPSSRGACARRARVSGTPLLGEGACTPGRAASSLEHGDDSVPTVALLVLLRPLSF